MTTETLHFQYDPMVLARQLLLIHFESKLKAFDTSLLSHGNYEIKYETPVFIREAVYDALENMSEYQIEYFMGSVAEDYDIKDEFKFDLYLPQIFKKIIKSDYFLDILEKNYTERVELLLQMEEEQYLSLEKHIAEFGPEVVFLAIKNSRWYTS